MQPSVRFVPVPSPVISAIIALVVVGLACKQTQPGPEARSGAGALPARTVKLDAIPGNVDRDLYRSFVRIADECKVDALTPNVRCSDAAFDNLVRLFARSPLQHHLALVTASHAFESDDLRVKVVAARFIAQAFPRALGSVPKPDEVRKLVRQLAELPAAQAIDICPAVTQAATAHELEDALYAVIDNTKDARLQVACYEPLMVRGRLRVLDKIITLAGSASLDVALAAVNAPRVMGGRTLEENQRLCDFMQDLLKDSRPLVAARAGLFLAKCGPGHLDALLLADEERVVAHKLLIAGMEAYRSLCAKTTEHPHGKPTRAQCLRIKKLAEAVMTDARCNEADRLLAMEILSEQFPDRGVVALVAPLADEGNTPRLSERARSVLRQLGREQRRAPQ